MTTNQKVPNPQINFQGMFGKMTFEPTPYQEYPKMLYREDGKILGTAENAMQERQLREEAGLPVDKVDPIAQLHAELAEARKKLEKYEGPAVQAEPAPVDLAKQAEAGKVAAAKPSVTMPKSPNPLLTKDA